MRRTTVTLTDDLAELAAHEARKRGTSVSSVVRDALAKQLGASGARQISFLGIVDDPAPPPAAELDDYLARHWADDIDRDRG